MKKLFLALGLVSMFAMAGQAFAAPFPTLPPLVFKPTCTISVGPLFQLSKTSESVLVIWQSVFATTESFKVTNPATLYSSSALNSFATVTVDTTKATTFALTGSNKDASTSCTYVLPKK